MNKNSDINNNIEIENESNHLSNNENVPARKGYIRILLHFFHFDILFNTINVFVLLAVFPLLVTSPIFNPFKNALSDFNITDIYFSKILPTLDIPKETDIVIINTGIPTSNGIELIGNFTLAKLISKVNEYSPTTVGINQILKKDTSEQGEFINYYLKNTLDETKNLVLKCRLSNYNIENDAYGQIAKSDSMFLGNAVIGATNYLKEKDKRYSTIRDFYPKLKYSSQDKSKNNDITYYSFGLLLAKNFNPNAIERLLDRKNSKETINFIGNKEKFEIIDAVDVLEDYVDMNIFKNKIVLLAPLDTSGTSDELDRIYYTPLNERSAGRTFADMYEVIIQANIISMLLTDRYFDEMSDNLSYFCAFVLCYINLALFKYISDKNKKLFEISALIIFSLTSIFIAYATVHFFYEYKYELRLTLAIVTSALSLFVFEIYYDTVKPLVLRFFTYLFSFKIFNFFREFKNKKINI